MYSCELIQQPTSTKLLFKFENGFIIICAYRFPSGAVCAAHPAGRAGSVGGGSHLNVTMVWCGVAWRESVSIEYTLAKYFLCFKKDKSGRDIGVCLEMRLDSKRTAIAQWHCTSTVGRPVPEQLSSQLQRKMGREGGKGREGKGMTVM